MRWCPIKSSSICRVDSVGLLPGEGAHTISLVAFPRKQKGGDHTFS